MSISSATSASAAAVSAQHGAAHSGQSSHVQRPPQHHKTESAPGAISSHPAQPTMATMGTGSKVNTVA
jgi:hypothetical protein